MSAESPPVWVSLVGEDRDRRVTWPKGWPVPRVDETVWVGDLILFVRSVSWYPEGSTDWTEPHVYLVLGPKRREP
jgi:hypothetical protein